jgi:hypothetical protein
MSNLCCARFVNLSVAFALTALGGTAVGCGEYVSHGNVRDAANTGGSSDVGGQTVGATCGGANPAAQTCRQLPEQCIPSECSCMSNGAWACSIACFPNMPLCSSPGTDGGGVGNDSGTDAIIHTSAVDAIVSEAGANDLSKDSTVSSSSGPCDDPCCGDPCCGDPCCGDPCCGHSCIVDPCGGDPCCGDPC